MNLGNGKFVDIAPAAGCDDTRDGRGVAIADLENNGKLDIVINNNNAAPTIYLNRLPDTGHWFRCKLVGAPGETGYEHRSSLDALGARVALTAIEKGKARQFVRWVEAGSGYASQSETTLHFGLGAAESIDALAITWPSGRVEVFGRQQLQGLIDRECTIREGPGIVAVRSARDERLNATGSLGTR